MSKNLSQLDILKSMEPDRMHLKALKELADGTVKPLYSICKVIIIISDSSPTSEIP